MHLPLARESFASFEILWLDSLAQSGHSRTSAPSDGVMSLISCEGQQSLHNGLRRSKLTF